MNNVIQLNPKAAVSNILSDTLEISNELQSVIVLGILKNGEVLLRTSAIETRDEVLLHKFHDHVINSRFPNLKFE